MYNLSVFAYSKAYAGRLVAFLNLSDGSRLRGIWEKKNEI